eukprot:4532871-Heterocapsa_arctica.AAC.1
MIENLAGPLGREHNTCRHTNRRHLGSRKSQTTHRRSPRHRGHGRLFLAGERGGLPGLVGRSTRMCGRHEEAEQGRDARELQGPDDRHGGHHVLQRHCECVRQDPECGALHGEEGAVMQKDAELPSVQSTLRHAREPEVPDGPAAHARD